MYYLRPMRSLIYDRDISGWRLFRDPEDILTADNPEEVLPVLQAVDAAARSGFYAVGYVSYEAAEGLDASLSHHDAEPGLPLVQFGLYRASEPGVVASNVEVDLQLAPVMSRGDYDRALEDIRRYLRQGDTYQVNYTHRLKGEAQQDPADVFAALVRAQPSNYAAMIDVGNFVICSVSPELFFEMADGRISTEPMKGTRPRGRHPEEDEWLRQALADSAKDRSENLMIVDMIRNDLGRIAEPGSVKVDELFRIRRLPTVWQQVSNVSARTGVTLAEVFAALFPCASVTGAPRHRTMEIIQELESSPRGIYTGAIGMGGPGGRARFSVAIRTLVLDRRTGSATYGTGGGIIWDSAAEDEWQESLIKAEILRGGRPPFQLLETMRFEPETGIDRLDAHLRRLKASGDYFGYPIDLRAITDRLRQIETDTPLRLRMLIAQDGTMTIEEHPLGPFPEIVRLKLASEPVCHSDVFLYHKTTCRHVYEAARGEDDDCDDVILWNEAGELTETTISNLYLEIDAELLTPGRDAGLLAGTYRQMMLAEGRAKETTLTKADLKRASRLFVSNGVRGLVPAVLV